MALLKNIPVTTCIYVHVQYMNVLPDAPFDCENQAPETSAKGGNR